MNLPELKEGETYIGAIGNKAGDVYHLILLSGDNDPASFDKQVEWAKSIGGELPNKLEAMMLFAHDKDQFEEMAYWTGETFIHTDDEEDTACAWFQGFNSGSQFSLRKSRKLRARAVRRVYVKEEK